MFKEVLPQSVIILTLALIAILVAMLLFFIKKKDKQ